MHDLQRRTSHGIDSAEESRQLQRMRESSPSLHLRQQTIKLPRFGRRSGRTLSHFQDACRRTTLGLWRRGLGYAIDKKKRSCEALHPPHHSLLRYATRVAVQQRSRDLYSRGNRFSGHVMVWWPVSASMKRPGPTSVAPASRRIAPKELTRPASSAYRKQLGT
jgi:hypothetical protein